jgi:hypothetical protein
MDVLLAGNVILPTRGHFAGYDVQRRLPVENIPGKSNTIPGSLKSVQLQPGIVFTFIPEWCSESARNAVQLHRGTMFSFARIPHIESYLC